MRRTRFSVSNCITEFYVTISRATLFIRVLYRFYSSQVVLYLAKLKVNIGVLPVTSVAGRPIHLFLPDVHVIYIDPPALAGAKLPCIRYRHTLFTHI